MGFTFRWFALLLAAAVAPAEDAEAEDVVLVDAGKARAAIFAPARLIDDAAKNPEPHPIWRTLKAEDNRRRVRESVKDLAAVLRRISGVEIPIVVGKPVGDDKRLPILIGELAVEALGKPQKSFPHQQGFRIVVSAKGIGLSGESDLATSYAIYTLLHDLGCRWYMPGPLGEVLPANPTLKLPAKDASGGPYTHFRGIWYGDNDYARRNRLGGLGVSAGHNLEFAVPKELREKRPEIRAQIGGKPHPHLVKWTHPLVAEAVADACLASLKADPDVQTYSLSPDDGATWDESDDAKHDAGDFDAATQTVSKSDRLMVFANRVATKVTAKHPSVKLGLLAYVDYTRPPVREKVHPAIVPQIAPITFSRAQPMSDKGEPNNETLRSLVTGWAKAAPEVSYYFYGYYLAEVASPNPMITKWGQDIPFIYRSGNCRYWQPETITNFETSLHAHTLGIRLAWDPAEDPKAIVAELHDRFYGAAGKEMAAYWYFIDDVWVNTPEYAGCGFGHLRRWTPDRLTKGHELMAAAEKACRTDLERRRVKLAAASFEQFELFMKLRRDLAEGRFEKLADDAQRYRKRLIELGEQHQADFCFARMGWTGPETLNVRYFDAFYKATYDDAARVAGRFQVLEQPPLRKWRVQMDQEKRGEAAGWAKPAFDDSAWKETDVAVDTWSALGWHNFMGSAWYRAKLSLPAAPSGKRVFLWVPATDGHVKVFLNGQHVPYLDAKGQKADDFNGYCQPASFDITAALKPSGENQLSLFCTRDSLNELGTGGLLAAPVVYREK